MRRKTRITNVPLHVLAPHMSNPAMAMLARTSKAFGGLRANLRTRETQREREMDDIARFLAQALGRRYRAVTSHHVIAQGIRKHGWNIVRMTTDMGNNGAHEIRVGHQIWFHTKHFEVQLRYETRSPLAPTNYDSEVITSHSIKVHTLKHAGRTGSARHPAYFGSGGMNGVRIGARSFNFPAQLATALNRHVYGKRRSNRRTRK